MIGKARSLEQTGSFAMPTLYSTGMAQERSTVEDYFYPDFNDEITGTMIASVSNLQEWTDQEQRVILALASRILELDHPRSMLDLGAGLGRLALQLIPYFNRGTLVEPDHDRRLHLSEICQVVGALDRGFTVAAQWPEDSEQDSYDVAIISHVFQHIPESSTYRILSQVSQRLRPGGLLYVATCFSGTSKDRFSVNQFNDQQDWEERSIDGDEFEYLARVPVKGQLPVRFFTQDHLVSMIEGHNFSVIDALPFHNVIDQDFPIRDFRDIAIIARRGLEN